MESGDGCAGYPYDEAIAVGCSGPTSDKEESPKSGDIKKLTEGRRPDSLVSPDS